MIFLFSNFSWHLFLILFPFLVLFIVFHQETGNTTYMLRYSISGFLTSRALHAESVILVYEVSSTHAHTQKRLCRLLLKYYHYPENGIIEYFFFHLFPAPSSGIIDPTFHLAISLNSYATKYTILRFHFAMLHSRSTKKDKQFLLEFWLNLCLHLRHPLEPMSIYIFFFFFYPLPPLLYISKYCVFFLTFIMMLFFSSHHELCMSYHPIGGTWTIFCNWLWFLISSWFFCMNTDDSPGMKYSKYRMKVNGFTIRCHI